MGLAPGLRATVRVVVADTDTAISAGSGDVPVLATPRLLALAEAAAVAAVAPHLEPGMTSVGTGMSLEHRRASPVGAEVLIEADLTVVDGRRLVFSFIARQRRQAQSRQAQSRQAQGRQAQGRQAQGGQAQGRQAQGRQAQGRQAQGRQAQGGQAQGGQAQGGQAQGRQDQAGQDQAGQARDGAPGLGEGEDAEVVVGAGTMERVVVDRDKFLARAQQ
jgi:predicted thioesterase